MNTKLEQPTETYTDMRDAFAAHPHAVKVGLTCLGGFADRLGTWWDVSKCTVCGEVFAIAEREEEEDTTDPDVCLAPDSDFHLDCGCVVAVDHHRWDPDLSDLEGCTNILPHTWTQALALAKAVY